MDFFIIEDDYKVVKKLLENTGYEENLHHELFSRFSHSNVHLMDIDLMYLEKKTFDQIEKEAKEITISGKAFNAFSFNPVFQGLLNLSTQPLTICNPRSPSLSLIT